MPEIDFPVVLCSKNTRAGYAHRGPEDRRDGLPRAADSRRTGDADARARNLALPGRPVPPPRAVLSEETESGAQSREDLSMPM